MQTPDVQPLSYWRVREAPAWPKIEGQGAMPTGASVTLPGADGASHTLTFPWGTIVRASSTCDPDRQLANLDAEPVPLVRTAVVAELAASGTLVPVDADGDGEADTDAPSDDSTPAA